MGKVQKKDDKKKSTSKFANAEYEPQNAKERIEHELHLLNVRKQAISGATKLPTVHKVKKATIKRGVNAKKQKKLARALMVADKEEKRVELAQSRAEKRKLGKQLWD